MTRRRLLAGVAAALLAVSFALPAWAQTDPSEVSGNELADGTWTGSFTASGTETRSEAGTAMTVFIRDDGTFNLTVDQGTTSGTFSSTGSNTWRSNPGESVTLTGKSKLVSGGRIAGGRTALTGQGQTNQAGTFTIESGGRKIEQEIDTHTGFAFTMQVTGASCEAAFGTLAGSFIRGTFTAINSASFERAPTSQEAGALIDGLVEYFDRFNNFIHGMGLGENAPDGATAPDVFPNAEFMDLLADAEAVLNELRNASACLSLQVGQDRLERWDNAITSNISSLILAAANTYNLSSNTVRAMVSGGLRMGAIGPGATDQATADRAEEALRSQMEVYVRQNVRSAEDCSGESSCILGTPDVITAAVVGTQMGWTYQIVGPLSGETISVPASDLFETFAEGNE